MRDYWYAECIPCKWQEQFTDQNVAIRAAEDHVLQFHRDVPPEVRGAKYMGHVQNRTENAIGAAVADAIDTGSGASRFLNDNPAPSTEWATQLAPLAPVKVPKVNGGNP